MLTDSLFKCWPVSVFFNFRIKFRTIIQAIIFNNILIEFSSKCRWVSVKIVQILFYMFRQQHFQLFLMVRIVSLFYSGAVHKIFELFFFLKEKPENFYSIRKFCKMFPAKYQIQNLLRFLHFELKLFQNKTQSVHKVNNAMQQLTHFHATDLLTSETKLFWQKSTKIFHNTKCS